MFPYLINNSLLNKSISGLCLINRLHINYPIRFIFNLTNRTKNSDKSTEKKNHSIITLSDNINSDYVKYFKLKKDQMRSFRQGYIKRVRLRPLEDRKYVKIRDRKRN